MGFTTICFIKECVKSCKKLDVLEIGGGSEYFGIEAINNGVRAVAILEGRKPHSILFELFSDRGAGTLIRK